MGYDSIKDNDSHGSVGDFLKKEITKNSAVSIVSAYFTIYAYNHLKEKLNDISGLRFLFGEPTFIKAMDPSRTSPKEFKIEDSQISLKNRMQQKSIARECADWIRKKVEIRSMKKPNFLHGKAYHIAKPGGVERAVVGSSNFTSNGLGMGHSRNIELNMIIADDRDRVDLKNWFNDLWNNQELVEDVKKEVLKYLKQLYKENNPEFIYYKTLYHLFENYLYEIQDETKIKDKTNFYDTEIWNTLYDFQKDGVKGAINKILRHNGCIIADSVGLGKTYEALAIIKYFELQNDKVLVICPKKLRNNWTLYQANQHHRFNPLVRDRFGYTLLYHTDMARTSGISDANAINLKNFNWSAFDLVVIDESHNFRGNPSETTDEDGITKYNRVSWLLNRIIKAGSKTKVLMLSATPVNNTLKDLRNQIAFITEGDTHALHNSSGIRDIDQTLKTAQAKFSQWAGKSRDIRRLIHELDSSFFKILDELTISRSRRHIIDHYNISKYNGFPERKKPISLFPEIDLDNNFPSYDKINSKIMKYRFSVYNPSAYVLEEKQMEYMIKTQKDNLAFRQADRERFLIGMMKINYLKRLESSIYSFEKSLSRTIDKIIHLLDKIAEYRNSKEASECDLSDYIPEEDEYDEDEEWQVGQKLKFNLADLDLDQWEKDLQKDRDTLTEIRDMAKEINPKRDAKLAELKNLIHEKHKNENKKVLIFTAFSDTAKYLYDNISPWSESHIACVTGSKTSTTYGRNSFDDILLNFSPFSKRRKKFSSADQSSEIDILIATDCISEGQNLQDCDFMVNYDIHWNPVRIIQRFGRIDRIDSQTKAIQMVNFWPTKDLDSYINLKSRVEARMALVDITTTQEDNLLSPDKLSNLISEELRYRNHQLKRLKDEVLDLEDIEGSISLSDFTLDNFRIELKNFIESGSSILKDSPSGLYAVVPSSEKIMPGVIFCLSHNNPTSENEKLNPLNPYFLVYIRDEGTVRYNYTNPKQILELFRQLCLGKKEPYQELCDLFNKKTDYCSSLNEYNVLLKKAVHEIIAIYQKKSQTNLLFDRSAVIAQPVNQLKAPDDFELITWLIII